MKVTFFSSVSYRFLTAFLIVSLTLAALPVNPALAANTGLNSPTTCTSGAGQWFNPGNATASDNNDTISNANNEVLTCTFNLPAIPAGNQIDGIEVVIEGSATGTREAAVDLSWNGGTTYTFGDPNTTFGATETTFTLGGATNTWGRTWAVGDFTAANFRVRLTSNGGSGNIELDHIQVRVTYSLPAEMDVQGNGISIADGDGTPSLTDGTNWGNVGQGVAVDRTFTILNTGTGDLTIGAITFTGGDAGDFSVVSAPASTVPPGGSTTITVRLIAGGGGGATRDTTINIVNNDANENPYNFDIEGTRVTTGSEVEVRGNNITIADGDATPSVADGTNFGSAEVGSNSFFTFTIHNFGAANLTIGAFTFTGDFSLATAPAATVTPGNSTTFQVQFTPSALGVRNGTVSFVNNDASENPYNFSLTGTGVDSTPPTVTLSSAAANPTNASPISVTAQFSETVTGFAAGDITAGNATVGNFVAVDGDTYTFDLTPTGQGLVTADIAAGVAQDAGGNGNTAAAQFSRTYDSLAPDTSITSNPTNPTASAAASFSFTGTDGGSGVASFECQIDGGGFSACTSPQNYAGLSDGSHTFQVRAIDNAGNVDPTPASFTWTIDTTAPDTTITANPTNPSASASASFSFTGSDPGGTGVASFECQIDGGGFSACTSPQNYTGLSDGSHTFQVRAIDNAGNVDLTPASFTWTIDATAPDTTITANPTNPSASASASFSFTGTDGGSGVASFECQLDGGGFSACTSPQNYAGLSDGAHTFQVRALDAVGNVDPTPASFTWTIDTTAPDTTITANPANPANDNTPTFSFTGTDGGSGIASFECQLDGGGFSACASPANFGPLADGAHTFDVRAIDNVGNVNPTPASFSWTVDTVSPDTTLTATPTDPSADNTPTFSFTGSDPGGTGVASFECQMDGGGFTTCNSGDSFGPLSDGSHTFEARAIDNAGNADATPASFTWTVDATAPDTTLNTTPANPDNDTTPTFTFSSTDGTATFECQMDGGGFTACNSGDSFGPLGDGSHTFEVRAVDPLGNTDPTPASFTWTVDTGAPDTTIDSNPANPNSTPDGSFTFSSPDADVTGFECQLDGGGFAACTSPRTYLGLSGSSHTFEVRALDNAGNVDPTPASFTWTIDLGYPTVSGTTPANNATLTSGPTQLVVNFSEDVKNDGSTEAANNTVNYLLVEDGANNTFNTLSCAGGLVADDTQIAVNSATYTNNGGSGPFTTTLNINGGVALPVGTYRLFICGTTSIEDPAGNELNNGTDAILNFTVVQQSSGGGGGGGNNNNNTNNNQTASDGFLIPVTGFPKTEVTDLPAQPASLAYAATDIWLEIPALGLKLSIVGVPKTKEGWDVTWLGRNAGWLNGSAFPTWKGNSVITAHVWDALNKPGPFAKLKDLKYGDQIRVHAFGQLYIYEIRESMLISPNNTAAMLKPEDKAWLTLITCEDYKESSNTYSYRRMVRAVLVSVTAEK